MRKLTFTLLLLAVSIPASAQWVAGGGYLGFNNDNGNIETDLSGVYASVGYLIERQGAFSFLPELRVGFGLGDDTVFGVDVELDNFLALSLRGQYDFDAGLYLFAQPSYARVEVTASAQGISSSGDDWDFGLGAGAGYKFTEQVWGELAWEAFDGSRLLTLGVKYAF